MLLHTMKLNQRPKVTLSHPIGSLLLLMLLLMINLVHYPQLVSAFQIGEHRSTGPVLDTSATLNTHTNQTHAPPETDANKSVHVTNLRLTSDYRAVKLQWSYAHEPSNPPASFNVRYVNGQVNLEGQFCAPTSAQATIGATDS